MNKAFKEYLCFKYTFNYFFIKLPFFLLDFSKIYFTKILVNRIYLHDLGACPAFFSLFLLQFFILFL